jgi:hypothetical protein
VAQLKKKRTVRSTRGTDGDYLVALVRRDDYRKMIGLYLALKPWVLQQDFALPKWKPPV